MNHNHINYQVRLDFIQNLLREHFNIENAVVSPIEYDADCPFKYNNFVYRATLSSPIISTGNAERTQPGCVAIPSGTTQFILRLTNPDAEGMNKRNRVENEVAIINLVSAALSHFDPEIVPSVYGWGSAAAESSQGWILQKLMPGVPVDAAFPDMDLKGKRVIFAQIVQILSALQKYQLPESITSFGGVTFDAEGHTVSAAMTSVDAGPWPSYEESFKGRIQVALVEADANIFIQGWRANGVRERIDAFVESGLAPQFQSLSFKYQKGIVHADFTTNNMLYDPISQRITALLDYDFACISHISYEFLRSFDGSGGRFLNWSGDENSEQMVLRNAKLRGFPSPLPQSSEEGVDWELVEAWEDELEMAQVQRPRSIEGIEKIADVNAMLEMILPWRITNSDMLGLQSEETTITCRNESEQELVVMLEHLGF